MKNKKNLSLLLIIISGLLILFNLIYLAQSFQFYDDGYGYDVSFDQDILVYLICSISILIYSVLCYKNINTPKSFYSTTIVLGSLLGIYNIGMFIKSLAKGKGYIEAQDYLYIGIIGCVVLAFVLINYFKKNK